MVLGRFAWVSLMVLTGLIVVTIGSLIAYEVLRRLSRALSPRPRDISESDLPLGLPRGTSRATPGFFTPWRGTTHIGYWKSGEEPDLPDPATFVDPTWDPAEREAIARYLDAGVRWSNQMGFSYCRFECAGLALGSFELSDGRYIWPEGLSHYLRRHQVRLPHAFVRHAQRNAGSTWYRRFEDLVIPLRWRRWNDPVMGGSVHIPLSQHRGWWTAQAGFAPGAIAPPRPPLPPSEQWRVWDPSMDGQHE